MSGFRQKAFLIAFCSVAIGVFGASSARGQSQTSCTKVLIGWVYDHDARGPIVGATVSGDPASVCGTDVTDNRGQFKLPLFASVDNGASIRVFVTKSGYPSQNEWVTFPKNGFVQIELWSERKQLLAQRNRTKPPAVITKAGRSSRPKLVLCLLVEGISTELLRRYKSEYTGGLALIFDRGAYFSNAYVEHFPTVGSTGYSVFSTGTMPAVSGIVGDAWFDRGSQRMVRSTDDTMVKDIGEPGIVVHGGDSPSYLLTRTIGDQLKAIEKSARVYSVGLHARAAVLLGGHAADGAFWFDLGSGQFVTSSYYPASLLPTWVSNFNAKKPCARFNGVSWTAMHPIAKEEPFIVVRDSSCFLIAERTPFPDEIVEDFAEELVKRENLGARQSRIDMLFVDLSSSDIMGHTYGPNSAQLHDVCLRIDGLLGRLLNLIDRTVGRDRTIIVLASDHGMAPLPEESVQVRLDAGRLYLEDLQDSVSAQLTKRFEGSQEWISQSTSGGFYLNSNLIQKAGFGEGEVMKSLVAALSQVPHILRVYSGEQLIARDVPKDSISQRVLNGFYATRSPDLVFIPEPYWQISSSRRDQLAIPTTHGSPFEYDSHIPIVFVGPSIKHGEYTVRASLNDVAPTLAALLEIEAPSGSDGKSLINVIEKQH